MSEPYHVQIVKEMQHLLNGEEDEQKQAASVLMLLVSYVLYASYNDPVHARNLLNELHRLTLDLLFKLEDEEKAAKSPAAKR